MIESLESRQFCSATLAGEVAAAATLGPTFTGGVFVGAAAPAAAGPSVKVFSGRDGAGQSFHGFYAYDQGFRGGVRVATGDVNGDGTPDVIVSAGPGGGPHVKTVDGTTGGGAGSLGIEDPAFRGGARAAG